MDMRAVVLARGVGRRMRAGDEATALSPDQERVADAGLKAMMPIGGHSFLEFVLSSLADAGYQEVGLVVGLGHDGVRRRFEVDSPPRRVRIRFLVQPRPLGTADALLAAQSWIGDSDFICLNADNLYPVDALRALAHADGPSLPVFEKDDLVATSNIPAARLAAFALVQLDAAGYLARIMEKPDVDSITAVGSRALVSMNCWRFDSRIFEACRDVPRSARGEFELPQAVGLALTRGVRFRAIPARGPVLDLSARSDVAEVARRLSGVEPRP
jgi:dTDP-glucose pyrophosphorylase